MNGKKFDIEWHSVLRDVIRNLWVVVCVMIIGLTGSYVATHSFFSPVYTSSASLIVNSAAGKANSVSNLSKSEQIAEIYSKVFVQASMKEKVCEHLQTSIFDGTITAKVNKGTNIMDVSVTASNPIVAYREISSILKVYPQLTSSLFSNGVVTVLRMPVVPKASSNSMTSVNYISISLICLLAGIALIAAISILRDTVKDAKSFNQKIDSTLIGIIPHEKKRLGIKETLLHKKKSILIYETAYTSLKFTENFNKIASKIQYAHQTKGKKVFCITSVAENEGKSTVSSNIAISLALRGNKVLLVDFDGKKPALYKVFEQPYEENAEIGEVISGNLDEKDFNYRTYKDMHLYFAFNAKHHSDYAACIESGAVEKYIDTVREKMDYIIIDTAPLAADTSVTGIARICDATYVVVRTDSVYSSVINDCLLTLTRTGATVEGCILNDEQTEFNVFGQLGFDESGYYSYKKYGRRYGRYGNYGRYGSYGRYGGYGRYGSYGRYSGYGKYSSYGKYGYYGKYGNKQAANPGAAAPLRIDPDDLSDIDIQENDDGGNV